jgi:hypothetical protein
VLRCGCDEAGGFDEWNEYPGCAMGAAQCVPIIHPAGTVVSTFNAQCPECATKGLARVIDLSCFGQSPTPI